MWAKGKAFAVTLGVWFAPTIALAAPPRTFGELVNRIVLIIDLIIPALVALAVVFFMINVLGAFGVIGGKGDGSAFSTEKFKKAAGWGLVIIFVMVSIWGILRLLNATFLSGGL